MPDAGWAARLPILPAGAGAPPGLTFPGPVLRRARREHPGPVFVLADARCLPFRPHSFDLLLDRGCFHYLPSCDRTCYATQARRVLRPGGRLLLRACLNSAGVRNDIGEEAIRGYFSGWLIDSLVQSDLVSDTRNMPALVARLRRP